MGLTEEKARETYDVVTAVVRFDSTTRTIKLAAIAIAARMRVNDLAHIPLSFPTYAGVMAHVAARATRELNLEASWQAHQVESAWHQF